MSSLIDATDTRIVPILDGGEFPLPPGDEDMRGEYRSAADEKGWSSLKGTPAAEAVARLVDQIVIANREAKEAARQIEGHKSDLDSVVACVMEYRDAIAQILDTFDARLDAALSKVGEWQRRPM